MQSGCKRSNSGHVVVSEQTVAHTVGWTRAAPPERATGAFVWQGFSHGPELWCPCLTNFAKLLDGDCDMSDVLWLPVCLVCLLTPMTTTTAQRHQQSKTRPCQHQPQSQQQQRLLQANSEHAMSAQSTHNVILSVVDGAQCPAPLLSE